MTSTNAFMEFRKKCSNILLFNIMSQNPIFSFMVKVILENGIKACLQGDPSLELFVGPI
jgi:hypothetical protein